MVNEELNMAFTLFGKRYILSEFGRRNWRLLLEAT